jgi:hypothetical protein
MTAVCCDCGGEIVFGRVFETTVQWYGQPPRVDRRCQECAETYAWACWPEDYGPCPYQNHKAGRA